MGLVRDCRYTEGCPKLEPVNPELWCSLPPKTGLKGVTWKWIDGRPVTTPVTFQVGDEGAIYLGSYNLTYPYETPTVVSKIATCPNDPNGSYSFSVVHVSNTALLVYTRLDCPVVSGYPLKSVSIGLGRLELGFKTHIPTGYTLSFANVDGSFAGVQSGHFLYNASSGLIESSALCVLRPSITERVYQTYFDDKYALVAIGKSAVYYDRTTKQFVMVTLPERVYGVALYNNQLFILTDYNIYVFDVATNQIVEQYSLQKTLSCGTLNLGYLGIKGIDLSLMAQGIMIWSYYGGVVMFDLKNREVMRVVASLSPIQFSISNTNRYVEGQGVKISCWDSSQLVAHCLINPFSSRSGVYTYSGYQIKIMHGLWKLTAVTPTTNYTVVTDITAQSKFLFYNYGGNLAHEFKSRTDPSIASTGSSAVIPPQ